MSSASSATLYDVSYCAADGLQWTGVVEPAADTLTLQTWSEGSGGLSWWTPVDPTSLVFLALQATSFPSTYANPVAYDVPDAWDGKLYVGQLSVSLNYLADGGTIAIEEI